MARRSAAGPQTPPDSTANDGASPPETLLLPLRVLQMLDAPAFVVPPGVVRDVLRDPTREPSEAQQRADLRQMFPAPHRPHAAPNPADAPTPAPVAESGTGGLYGQEEGTE
jgi:hypothetical protein